MQKDDFKIRKFPDLSAFQADSTARSLRVCIATEEIVGPVRNGGIASTYYHLARMLADDGHKVTVVFLKEDRCENETIEHWVKWYAQMGITFLALPYESIPQQGFSPFWQRRYYALYRWLSKEEPFDIVHTSEWRGGAFYALGAKRLGLKFQDTLFLVKSSSPHIWNRHYQMLSIKNDDLLACSYAEQKVIEWADIVIGGSAHLLSFMERVGYRLPEGRIYVQPNVIDFQDLDIEEKRPDYEYGEKVKSGELVFFGRLEARKGLEIFCDALDQLLRKGSGPIPDKVYFLGKQGQKMPAYPDMSNIDFIRQRAENWPFAVEMVTDLDQKGAISFLCARPRIAIMPSLIENSTMTVYEALVHKIPFLATNVGGTPELIAPEFHADTLTEPLPGVLARDLKRVLEQGGTVANASFDYNENLKVWRGFHAWLSHRLDKTSVSQVISEMSYDSSELKEDPRQYRPVEPSHDDERTKAASLAAVVYHHDDPSGLRLTLGSLKEQHKGNFDEIVVVTDGQVSSENSHDYDGLKATFGRVIFQDNEHQCVGASYNSIVGSLSSEVVIFLKASEHVAKADMAQVLKKVFMHDHVRLATSVHDHIRFERKPEETPVKQRTRYLPMGGDLAAHALHEEALGGSCFAVRRELFLEQGAFFTGYHIPGVEDDFMTRCILRGEELWVIPQVLHETIPGSDRIRYNLECGRYLRLRPIFDSMPYSMRRLLLRLGGERVTMGTCRINPDLINFVDKTPLSFNVLKSSQQGDSVGHGMGVIFHPEYGLFACVLDRNMVDQDECIVTVTASDTQMSHLFVEILDEDYLMAKWKFNLKSARQSRSWVKFTCKAGKKKFERFVAVNWDKDGTVNLYSKKNLVVGDIAPNNAIKALPLRLKSGSSREGGNIGLPRKIKKQWYRILGKN